MDQSGEIVEVTLEDALADLELGRKKLQEVGLAMFKAYGGLMYPMDLLAQGALRRSFAQIEGFRALIQARNMLCAGAILRMQIDTALRFYAAFIVDDPHEFAMEFLRGKRICDLKDRNGRRMTDAYLISQLENECPWLRQVYKETSGFIHLSAKHYFGAIAGIDKENHSASMEIGAEDPEHAWPFYIEATLAFSDSLRLFLRYLSGWVFTKNNPGLVEKMKNEQLGQPSDLRT